MVVAALDIEVVVEGSEFYEWSRKTEVWVEEMFLRDLVVLMWVWRCGCFGLELVDDVEWGIESRVLIERTILERSEPFISL